MGFYPLVSCIVPVYNATKYLDQGINSLLTQTYENLQIILVDDRSTDNSWDICQGYAEKHLNVLAFRNESNSGGPMRGRERGIKEAHGEWMTFMDCDDYVEAEYIENLVKATHNGKYDIAITGHSRLYPDGKLDDFLWDDYTQTKKERMATFFEHYFLDQDFWTDPADTAGQNLVRAEVARKADLSKYPATVWGEDSLMALAFLDASKTGVNFVDTHDFIWRQRPGSGSHGGFSDTADRQGFYRACYDIFLKNNLLPKVSIVVPIFNVERYLKDCIESLITQTYPNLEIVLVDDKSPDKSGLIADEYAHKDTRIQVIHKPKNEGLNKARATGFKVISGEYVMFVDSDDLLVKDCIESTLRAILKEKTDFVRFSMVTFKDKKDLSEKLSHLSLVQKEVVLRSQKDLYITQFDPGVLLSELPMNSMTVWGALYPKKLVDKVDWEEANFRIYEDNIWTLRLLENASSGTYLGYTGYLYRFDDTITNVLSKSLTGNDYNGKTIGYMEFWNYVWNEYRRYNQKYTIGAEALIEDVIKHLTVFRASHIAEKDLWGVEGNARYLPGVVKVYQDKLDNNLKQIALKDAHIHQLEVENRRIQNELESHLSIKRSAKLTLGNLKRRVSRNRSGKI